MQEAWNFFFHEKMCVLSFLCPVRVFVLLHYMLLCSVCALSPAPYPHHIVCGGGGGGAEIFDQKLFTKKLSKFFFSDDIFYDDTNFFGLCDCLHERKPY